MKWWKRKIFKQKKNNYAIETLKNQQPQSFNLELN